MNRYAISLFATIGLAATAGCSAGTDSRAASAGDDDTVVGTATSDFSLASLARVRIVHASPDAPGVDIYVRGIAFPIARNVKFTNTTRYVRFVPGSYTIDLRAAPSTVSDPVAYSTGPLNLPARARITAVAEGLLASNDPDASFRVAPLVEQFAAAGAGSTSVRIVHASADAPTVGVDVGNDDPQNPEVPALARFADTGAAGIALPANAALQVGIDAGGSRVTAFTTPPLPSGAGLFVIATGLLGKLPREAAGFGLLAVGPSGTVGFIKQNPVVYALHASPDAPAVDAFAGSAKAIGGLSFGNLSAPVQVPPGSVTLDLYPASADAARPDDAPVYSQQVAGLAAGQRYLAIATGFLAANAGEPSFQLAAFGEQFLLDTPGGARIQAIHASPDAPPVDVGVATGTTLTSVVFPNLSFGSGTSSDGLALPAGAFDLGVAPAGDAATVATFAVTTAPGERAFVVAAGALDAQRGASFRLIGVDTTATPWAAATILPQ